jgi:sulfoxide reductase catalytic subunit YedY
MHYLRKPDWAIPEREATSESIYMDRRRFLVGALGVLAGGIGGRSTLAGAAEKASQKAQDPTLELYPARRNPDFTLDRPLTKESVAATYNNFYEFGPVKTIHYLAQRLKTRPWQVRVEGLVRNPRVFEIDDLIRSMPLEERLYRFRCVEAWAMAVPWTGFPFSAVIKVVEPKSEARFVKLTTFLDRTVAFGQLRFWYPWPYAEGLTMEEATNELAILATGIYGKPLPKQHGAPIRLVTPWKYGFKNIKSIVSIEFVKDRPKTFWETVGPDEYGFWKISHPRWSQATERMIGTNERRPTQIFNGYEKWVAPLYPDLNDRRYFI